MKKKLLAAILCLFAFELLAQSSQLTEVVYFQKKAENEIRIYNARWFDWNGNQLKESDFFAISKQQPFNVKNPNGVSASRVWKIEHYDSDEPGAEMLRLELSMPTNGSSYVDAVFPMVTFNNAADRDKFITNNAGALPWHSLDKEYMLDQLVYEDHIRHYVTRENYFGLTATLRSLEQKFIVIEEHPFIKKAVNVNFKMKYPITLDEDNNPTTEITDNNVPVQNRKLRNIVVATYTNTAPYPVLISAFEPVIDPSSITHQIDKHKKDTKLNIWKGLWLEAEKYAIGEVNSWNELDKEPEQWFVDDRERPYQFAYYRQENLEINNISNNYAPIILKPYEQITVSWGIWIKSPESLTSFVVKKRDENSMFAFDVPIVIQTTTPHVIRNGGENIMPKNTQVTVTIPGVPEESFAVLNSYPLVFGKGDASKKITLECRSTNKLGKVEFCTLNASNEPINPITINANNITRSGSNQIIELKDYIGTTTGNLALRVYNSDNELSKTFTFYVRDNVTTSTAKASKRLVVRQEEDNKFKLYTWLTEEQENDTDKTVLLDISTPLAETTDGIEWNIGAQAIVNGILATGPMNGLKLKITENEVLLEPANNNTELFHTGTYLHNDGIWDGMGTRLAKTGQFSIRLTSDKKYNNAPPMITDGETQTYPDIWVAPELNSGNDFSVNLFGDKPLAEFKNPVLYRNQLSLGGSASLSALLPFNLFSNYLICDIDLNDIRLGTRHELIGVRGGFDGFVGLNDPLGVLTSGGSMEVKVNTLPENMNKKFYAAGEMGVAFVGGLQGEIKMAPALVDYMPDGSEKINSQEWFVDDVYGQLDLPTPLITSLGLGIAGISETVRNIQEIAVGQNDVLSLPIKFTGHIGLGLNDLVTLSGKMSLGPNIVDIFDGQFDLIGIKLLTGVHCTTLFEHSGFISLSDIPGLEKIPRIPMMKVTGSLGGGTNFLNIFIGTIEGKVSIDYTKYGNDVMKEIAQLFYENEGKNINSFSVSVPISFMYMRMKIKDVLWGMVDFRFMGKIDINVPEIGIPLAGTTLLSANAFVDKAQFLASAGVTLKAGITFNNKFYGIDKDLTVGYMYTFVEKKGEPIIHLRASQTAGAPLRDKMYKSIVKDEQGKDVELNLYSPNFVPMTKNSDVNPTLRSFSDQFEHTKVQTMSGNVSNAFTIALRSKSPNTGLKITCTSGSAAGLVADRIVASDDLVWTKSNVGDYYLSTAFVEIPDDPDFAGITLEGEWKVEAYNANVTAFDPDGLIDCDFFYTLTPAAIENLVYDPSTGTVTWDNTNLAADDSYRVSFILMNTADNTYHEVSKTDEWDGNSPMTTHSITTNMLNTNRLLASGEYELIATLEKNDGEYVLPTADDEFDENGDRVDGDVQTLWVMLNQVSSAAFNYVNPNEPTAGVTNLQATTANGEITLTWTAPADMSLVDGYSLLVYPEGDKTSSLQFLVDKNAVSTIIAASPLSNESAGIEYGKAYTYVIKPYNLLSDPETYVYGPQASITKTIDAPQRPRITSLFRLEPTENAAGSEPFKNALLPNTDPRSPEALLNFTVETRNDHRLLIEGDAGNWSITANISEEKTLFAATSTGTQQLAYTDITANITRPDNNLAVIPFTGMDDGMYDLIFTLTGANGDFNTYMFNIRIDNTPPLLMIGERTKTIDGMWVVSGATDANARLEMSGATVLHNNGAFTLDVTGMYSLSLYATDDAGNITVISTQFDEVPQFEGDITKGVKIVESINKLKMGTTTTFTAKVLRNNVLITLPDAETSNLTWSILQGDAASINATTGVVTPLSEGKVVIRASYRNGLFSDIHMLNIADEFPIYDLYVSEITNPDRSSVRLSFTEPEGASGIKLEYSTDEPVNGEVLTGWKAISATFDNNGHVTVSGLDGTADCYFRLIVTGGLNSGMSNVTGRLGIEILKNPQPDIDNTQGVKIDEGINKVKLGTTVTLTAKVLRDNMFITLPEVESNKITWSILQGDAASINGTTGAVTPLSEGAVIVQASYRNGLFSDIHMLDIAEEFPIYNLYVSEITNPDRSSVRLSFAEPEGASEIRLEYSTDKPVNGEVLTGWTVISAIFDQNGNITISGLDGSSTYYFRLIVTGGLNSGISNVAELLGQSEENPPSGLDKVPTGEVSAYPNPTTGIMKVTGITPGAELKLYSANGMLISTCIAQGTELTVNISRLKSGIYFINIGGQTLRVIKK